MGELRNVFAGRGSGPPAPGRRRRPWDTNTGSVRQPTERSALLPYPSYFTTHVALAFWHPFLAGTIRNPHRPPQDHYEIATTRAPRDRYEITTRSVRDHHEIGTRSPRDWYETPTRSLRDARHALFDLHRAEPLDTRLGEGVVANVRDGALV